MAHVSPLSEVIRSWKRIPHVCKKPTVMYKIIHVYENDLNLQIVHVI
jgi:preprotein translocase subunit Sss1